MIRNWVFSWMALKTKFLRKKRKNNEKFEFDSLFSQESPNSKTNKKPSDFSCLYLVWGPKNLNEDCEGFEKQNQMLFIITFCINHSHKWWQSYIFVKSNSTMEATTALKAPLLLDWRCLVEACLDSSTTYLAFAVYFLSISLSRFSEAFSFDEASLSHIATQLPINPIVVDSLMDFVLIMVRVFGTKQFILNQQQSVKKNWLSLIQKKRLNHKE